MDVIEGTKRLPIKADVNGGTDGRPYKKLIDIRRGTDKSPYKTK